jgi:predicted DNA-binding transcriptional regulator AlpA
MTYHRSLVYMPKKIPALRDMLADIGHPSPKEVAKALKVTERTVWRWLREDKAPHAAMLAIYWLTRWGVSEIDTAAHNAAIYSAGMARCLQDELDDIKSRLARISKIGDFGSSNDPAPGVIQNATVHVRPENSRKTESQLCEISEQPSVESDDQVAVEPNNHAGLQRFRS